MGQVLGVGDFEELEGTITASYAWDTISRREMAFEFFKNPYGNVPFKLTKFTHERSCRENPLIIRIILISPACNHTEQWNNEVNEA